jgi:hypothetical protein
MNTDLHPCVLTGVRERNPITRFADHGTQRTGFKQHLDSLRRKDSLRGAETTEISVRLGNYSASHFEGSAFTLTLPELGPTGPEFRLGVPVESYSQGAEQASDLGVGDSVLAAGQWKFPSWTTTDGMQQTSLAVLARLLKVLTPAAVTTADHTEATPPLSRSGAWKPHHREGGR